MKIDRGGSGFLFFIFNSAQRAAKFVGVWYSPAFSDTSRFVSPEDKLSRIAALVLMQTGFPDRNQSEGRAQRQ
jgi:hypothetical protein